MHATRPISLRMPCGRFYRKTRPPDAGSHMPHAGYICLTEWPRATGFVSECLLWHQGLHSPCHPFALDRMERAPSPPQASESLMQSVWPHAGSQAFLIEKG